MSKKFPEPTTGPRERGLLVGVDLRANESRISIRDSLTELALLADTAGLEVVGEIQQRLDHPNSQTFIGTGKVEEMRALVQELQADVVLWSLNRKNA